MNTSSPATEIAIAIDLKVTENTLTVELKDGRTVSIPLGWYPRLAEGTVSERRRWKLIGPGIGIHWPALDEDISLDALLRGLASNESAASLQRWRVARRSPANKRMEPTRSSTRKRAAHS